MILRPQSSEILRLQPLQVLTPEPPKVLTLMDTTLRDGLQSPEAPAHGKYAMNIEERLQIFEALIRYGIKNIEVFSPSVSSIDKEALYAYIERRNQLEAEHGHVNILVHARCNEKDVQDALEVKVNERGIDGLNLFMGTSPASTESNHGHSIPEVASIASTLLAQIRHEHPDLILRFSGEDAFRTDINDLTVVFDQVIDSVDFLGIPDTQGEALPEEVAERISYLKARYKKAHPNVGLEGHFHNNLGLAIENARQGFLGNLERLDVSISGEAERSGITSLTGILYLLYSKYPQYRNLVEQYLIENSYGLNILFASITRTQVSSKEPVSLTNATHYAGVHTAAMLKNPDTYQNKNLKRFGVDETKLLLNPYSGWNIIEYYLTYILYFQNVTAKDAKEITTKFKDACYEVPDSQRPEITLTQVAQEHGLIQIAPPPTHIEVR